MALDVVRDRLVEAVAADAQRSGNDDTVERDHRHLRGAAADVDDHIARRIGDRHPRADRGRQRLADQICPAGACRQRGIAHGAALHAGHAGGHADHHLRPDQREPAGSLVDEVSEHLLGYDVVGDDAVPHRANDLDRFARLAPQHVAGFQANRFDFAIFRRDGDDGRFVDDDSSATHEDEDVRRPEINPDLFDHERLLRSRIGDSRH